MSFEEDLVFAIVQGNISTLESFDLDSKTINQRVFIYIYFIFLTFLAFFMSNK